MELRENIIDQLLSNVSGNLLVLNMSAQDAEYEYKLDGISLNSVSIFVAVEVGYREIFVYNRYLARFFQYDFISNVEDENKPEAAWLETFRDELLDLFEKADERGYNEFNNKVEYSIKPYQNTDERVTRTVWKLLNQLTAKEEGEINLDSEYINKAGYKNGGIRKAVDIICEHPDMFFEYPGLLIKHRAIDHSRSYYFVDAFWSGAAYNEAVELLSEEFLSKDGQTWNYRQKGNKTVFIALFEELYVKDYLKKRLTSQEIKNIALNSFNLDISERTFNEGAAIINAQRLFKYLPIHMRYVGEDEETYNRVYKRR